MQDDYEAALRENEDALRSYTRTEPSEPSEPPYIPDPTGLGELMPIMLSGKQILDSAKMAGFTEAQAFAMVMEFFKAMMQAAVVAQS